MKIKTSGFMQAPKKYAMIIKERKTSFIDVKKYFDRDINGSTLEIKKYGINLDIKTVLKQLSDWRYIESCDNC